MLKYWSFDILCCHNLKRLAYLETYHQSLESYIESARKGVSSYENWNTFPNLCFQLADAVSWLHHHCSISLEGRLNPRNVFVKGVGSQRLPEARYLKVFVPERLNPFNNMDQKFAEAWTRPDWPNHFQKDVASMAMIIYFIQTCGDHPYQDKNRQSKPTDANHQSRANNYMNIRNNVITNPFTGINTKVIEERQCFCKSGECKASIGCKYRYWVNQFLAKDVILAILQCSPIDERDGPSFTQWINHPFFWKNSKILYFIQRVCAYLDGIVSTNTILFNGLKQKLNEEIPDVATVTSELFCSFPKTMAFFQESKRDRKYGKRNLFRKKTELLKWIRDKVRYTIRSFACYK